MISSGVFTLVLISLLTKNTNSYEVTVDVQGDYWKVPTLNSTSRYVENIAASLPDFSVAAVFNETITAVKGAWVESNKQYDDLPDSPQPIQFSLTENFPNFTTISLKYYCNPAGNPAGVNLILYRNASEIGRTTLPNSVMNVWSTSNFTNTEVSLIPAPGTTLSLKVDLGDRVANPANYFVLDTITFISAVKDDCRLENQNVYTPSLTAHGEFYICVFNSYYSRWFLHRFKCPIVGAVQHILCKPVQKCLATCT